ncbi:MAG: DUF1761 domain-containing protein [Candidatus Amoebophilus sp.]
MINLFSAINWISVLIAFVAYFLLGALWFTLLFKKQYANSLGKKNDTLKNSSPIFFIGPAVCSLIITITSAILIDALGIDSYGKAIEFAFIIGIGYLFTNTVNIAINPNIPKPILYGIISGMFHLIGILIVSVVIVAMR